MGKSQKKKQALVAFELSKETVLGFTPGDFLSIDDSWAALPTVVEVLLSSLQDAHSFKEQVLIIQSHKSKIRKFLTAENTSRPELVSAVRILLQLYLLPKYTPLRNSLEWIGETIGRIERGLLLSLREVMAETVGAIMLHFCISVAKFSCTSENVFGEIKEEIPLELLMAWTATFNIIAVLDSDFLLLDLAYVYSDDEYILLDVLISALSRVIQFCTATIVVSVESADKQAGSAELLRYGECCSEASRGIMTALKARKSTFVVNAQVSKELDLVANVMSSLLVKEGIDRDLATSVGMCIAAILWFNQPKECRSSISFHCCQILAVLSLLLNYQINDQLRTIEHALYGIPHVIINGIPKYSFIARTAIVRGIIVIYSDEVLFSFPGVDQIMEIRDYLCNSIPAFEGSQILEEQIASQPLIISALFEFMNYVSDHELPLVKNYGFYSFEAWLTKIIAIIQRTGSYAVMVRDLSSLSFHESLFTISSKALLAWSHPSKQVNQAAPLVFQKLLSLMEIVYPFESNFAIWGRIISEIQSIPIQHRARYQALTQIVLLLGPITLLRFNTTIINDLIQAIKYREVCSTGTLLLSKILESCIIELSSDMDRPQRIQAVRNLWDEASISMICSDDERVQVNANDYLIPAILQIDSTCVAHLLAMIRKHLSMKLDNYRTSLGLRTNADNVVVTHSRAIISVVMYARKFGLAGKEIVQENDMVGTVYLTEGEIIACCVSADSNLCLNAFALLTTSNRTSEPMRKHEVSILQRCLHYCLKSSEADHRHRLLKALKDMLVRVKESCRIATRDLQKLQMKATKSTVSEDEMQALKSIIDVGDEIVVWLLKEVMRNLFPGAPFDRELIGLEIVACVLDTLGENDELVKKIFLSADLYLSLVNLLVSSWDRTRKMASDLLLRFPTPPTQFENPEKLVKWGLQLTSSPRLREADAGAFVLKNVYSAYCVKLCQSVKLSAVDTDSQITTWLCLDALHSIPLFQFSSQEFRKAEFLIRMTYTIGQRLKALDGLFTMVDIGKILQTNLEEDVDESGNCINIDDVALPLDEDSTDDVPLCNGLILALRICLSDDPSSFHSPLVIENNGMMNLWRIIFRKIYEQAIAAMQLGMRVVAEAATDVPFAPTNSDLAVTNPESDNSSKGPVNTATISMAASYVNANSLVNTDCNSDVGVTLKRKVQMCVVGAWLLVKESCQMLAHLVALAPIPSVNPEGIQRNLLLSSEEIEKAGWQIIEGLGRLKHMGAIAEAHAALHSIAATLLRYGERNPHLCGLPCIWLQSLLSRLEGDQQVFILRRSAGFAYSFVSLLRAEPSNYDSVLLPIAMSRLLNTVKLGLLADSTCRCSFGKSVSSDDMPESECSNIHSGGDNWRWKMAVHALNVLRLIISDGSTAVDEFISAATQYTIHGFKSSQWAVRNSCMMVFSSIIQKSIDRDKNNSGSITAATVTEYFRRFPELLPFLHKELLDIIVNLSTSGIESPSLYPLLLLISKLRSSVDDSVTCGGNNIFATLSEFEDILLQCHSCRSYRVREMAAKAYCAVVPLNRIPQKLQSLHVNYVACTITNGRHGLLMVIQQLLANLIRHCDLVSDMDAIMLRIRLDTVAKFMDLWIPLVVNISSNHDIIRVPATTIVWIKILEDVKILSRDSSACQIIDQILFGTSQQILEKVKSINLANQHPFQQLLFERTLETLLNRLGSESKPVKGSATADRSDSVLSHENIVLALIPLLHHPLSELRKGVLNGLRNIVSLDRSTCQHIFKALQDRILLEKEPPIQNLALDLLLRYCSKYSADLGSLFTNESAASLWHVLHALIVKPKDTKLKEKGRVLHNSINACHALEILGWLVQIALLFNCGSIETESSEQRNTSNLWNDRTDEWLILLETASIEDYSATLREAACKSIQLSLVLSPGAEKYDRRLYVNFRAYLTLLTLLQDDDADVREQAALVIHYSMKIDNLATMIPANEIYCVQLLESNICELVLRCSSIDTLLKLHSYVSPKVAVICSAESIKAVVIADPIKLSQQIFEAELANIFIEIPLAGRTLIQIDSSILRRIDELAMNDSKMDQRGNTSTGIVDEASKTINNHFTKIEQLLADVLDVMKLCCEKDTQLSSSPSNRITNSVNSDSPNCSCVAGWSYQKDVFNFLYLSLIRLTDCFKTMDQSDHVEMVIRRFDAEVKRTCELVAVNQLLHSKIRSLADLMLEIFS